MRIWIKQPDNEGGRKRIPPALVSLSERIDVRRIVGCVSVYQEEALLPACLEALRQIADWIIVVDGRYADFEAYGDDGLGASTDATLAITRQLTNEVIEAPDGRPWTNEIAKRNAYMTACREGDMLLVVDADERVEGEMDRVRLATRSDWCVHHYCREMYDQNRARRHGHEESLLIGATWIHRLHAWRAGIHYEGTHHAVHVGAKLINPNELSADPTARFPGLRLFHEVRRDADRSLRKNAYYLQLAKAEKAYRARMSI